MEIEKLLECNEELPGITEWIISESMTSFDYRGDSHPNFKNLPHGTCRMIFPGGEIFIGNTSLGQLVNGVMIFPEKGFYIGSFQNGKRNGNGVYVSDKMHYNGTFRDDSMCGNGTLTGKHGSYNGEFFDHERHGFGTLVCTNGNSFIGFFERDKKQGRGQIVKSSGEIYECTFENDSIVGPVTYTPLTGRETIIKDPDEIKEIESMVDCDF